MYTQTTAGRLGTITWRRCYCGRIMLGRPDKRTCSHACRQKQYRYRRALKRALFAGLTLVSLAGCASGVDFDMLRDMTYLQGHSSVRGGTSYPSGRFGCLD